MVDLDGLRALRRHRVKAAFTASRASPESAEIGQLSLNAVGTIGRNKVVI